MKIAIVTGASSGLGKEFVVQINRLYKNLDEIWVIARRIDKLEQLKQSLSPSKTKIRTFECDLTNNDDIEIIKEKLIKDKPNIRMLVNSAGFGKIGKFTNIDLDSQCEMIRLNCEALTMLTGLSIPYMKKGSRIINIASSAAFIPQPNFLVYAATKSFVLSFSRALNCELAKKEIHVTAVTPGPVATEFFDIAEKDSKKIWIKDYIMACPKDVVRKALIDSIRKKDISIYGALMKILYAITTVSPYSPYLKLMSKLEK